MRPEFTAAAGAAARRPAARWTAAWWAAARWTGRRPRTSLSRSVPAAQLRQLDSRPPDRTDARGGTPESRQAAVAELMAWTQGRWEQAPAGYAEAAGELTEQQRLSLGLVLFGRATYQAVASATGLTPAQVSTHCSLALRQLRGR